ncbi:DUF4160 domain-containing protein [Bordetella flabilis]|nr:DUF4160 domain-containing protein [Bordetella flabilis]
MNDGREALIVIETMAVLSGAIKPRELVEALAWARNNSAALMQRWRELNP